MSWGSCFLAPEELHTNTKVLHGPLRCSAQAHSHSQMDLLMDTGTTGKLLTAWLSRERGATSKSKEDFEHVLRHHGEQPNPETNPTDQCEGSHQPHTQK